MFRSRMSFFNLKSLAFCVKQKYVSFTFMSITLQLFGEIIKNPQIRFLKI